MSDSAGDVTRLAGKVALVTGGSQGIGRAIALRLAREGARVVVNDLEQNENADETLRLVTESGAEATFVAADVGQVADVARLVETGVAHFGRLDVLINNAGVELKAPFWEVAEADYDTVMGVNLKGAFFASQAFVKHLMEKERPGVIVNISSVHEELSFPHFTAYCAAKGGLKMMMRNLAVELGPLGIRVCNVAPGAIRTPINAALLDQPEQVKALRSNISLGRLGEPEDVAGMVAFLASEEAKYLTGATYYVDGGLTWHYKEQ